MRGLCTNVKTATALRDESGVEVMSNNKLLCDRGLSPMCETAKNLENKGGCLLWQLPTLSFVPKRENKWRETPQADATYDSNVEDK